MNHKPIFISFLSWTGVYGKVKSRRSDWKEILEAASDRGLEVLKVLSKGRIDKLRPALQGGFPFLGARSIGRDISIIEEKRSREVVGEPVAQLDAQNVEGQPADRVA